MQNLLKNLIKSKIFKPKMSDIKMVNKKMMKCCPINNTGCAGAVYGLGFIGAAIYYISNATGFWSGVLGFLKAIVWPVFAVMKLLGM